MREGLILHRAPAVWYIIVVTLSHSRVPKADIVTGLVSIAASSYAVATHWALGPSLGYSSIQNPLQNTTLELHDANGVITATNDDWEINDQTEQSQEAEIRATGLPPPNGLESAIIATLPAGPHTAIVRGKDNTTEVGLVEIYKLP